jgi:hypothetical protein
VEKKEITIKGYAGLNALAISAIYGEYFLHPDFSSFPENMRSLTFRRDAPPNSQCVASWTDLIHASNCDPSLIVPVIPLKLAANPAGKVLELLFDCRSEINRFKIEIETNFPLADMEPMRWVKISLVSEARDRRLRAIKFAQFGEQVCRGRRRRVNICSEPELATLS